MQVTILHPLINLTERGQPQFAPLTLNGAAPSRGDAALDPQPKEKPQASPRSKGLHVSTLIKRIAVNMGLIKSLKAMGGKWKAEPVLDEEDFPLIMAMGMAWEDWLSQQYSEMIYHPGELALDGVAGSPDGITPCELPEGAGDAVIEEFKLTLKSGRHDIHHSNYLMWLWQVMAYCKMLGTLCARLHVLFINGCYDYAAPGLPPIYRIYVLQFSQEEVDRTWAMLMTERDTLLQEKKD